MTNGVAYGSSGGAAGEASELVACDGVAESIRNVAFSGSAREECSRPTTRKIVMRVSAKQRHDWRSKR